MDSTSQKEEASLSDGEEKKHFGFLSLIYPALVHWPVEGLAY
jgi:hypothetical protein